MLQTELRLSTTDRFAATAVRAKGLCSARQVNRAHILLALDQRIPESQIMAVLGVGRMTVWRARAAYLEGGLDLALCDVPRSGRPPKYDAQAEARVAALACTAALAGSARWTLERLHEAIREEPGLSAISRETVRRLLKKLPQTLAQSDVVRCGADRGVSAAHVAPARVVCLTAAQQRTRRVHRRKELAALGPQPHSDSDEAWPPAQGGP